MPPTRNRRFAAARPALNLIAILTCALLLGAAESAAGASTTTCDIVIRDGTGRLKAGYHADVVVSDPKTVIDRSTFAQPHQLAIGVKDVLVNGGHA